MGGAQHCACAGLRVAYAGNGDKPRVRRLEFAAISVENRRHEDRGDEGRQRGPTRFGHRLVAGGVARAADAQLFGNPQDGPFTLRPPRDVPSVAARSGPEHHSARAATSAPEGADAAVAAAGQQPRRAGACGTDARQRCRPGRARLRSARGSAAICRQINGGLHWRVYPAAEPNGGSPPGQGGERRRRRPSCCRPAPTSSTSASASPVRPRRCSCAPRPAKDVFEIPAGGLRIEGHVGDARIPQGQISFDLYKGSQFEPGDKRPIAHRRHDRRRGAGAGGHLSHRFELRRCQLHGPLRHPRAGRQAHRHDRQSSRRDHHAQAGERARAARRAPIPNGRCSRRAAT